MKIHVVQKGDTLWELAKQYDVDFEELKQSNPQLSSPDMIMPGMKIKIPSSAKSVQKEEAKEEQKSEAVHPYKEMQQTKPVPVMKEDEKEKQKPVQPHMPEQPEMPKEQQKKPSEPQQPEQPKMPAPQQPAPAPQMTNQQVQPVIQMPIMEQELKNYTSVQVPETPQYQKPEEHEQPMPQPMYQSPMPPPVAMVPVCCQMMPPGAMPMPHQHFPVMPPHGHECALCGHPGTQQGYPYPSYDHGMMMESPNFEMPVKPSLMKNDNDCGCGDKKPMPAYQHNEQETHHYPHYGQQPYHFEFPSAGPVHQSDKPQSYPPYYGAMPNYNPYPVPPGSPYAYGTGYREEEDESSGE